MAMKGKEKAAAGKAAGEIFRVAGPVVTATGLRPRMYDVQFVGEEQLLGEGSQARRWARATLWARSRRRRTSSTESWSPQTSAAGRSHRFARARSRSTRWWRSSTTGNR